MERCLTDGAMLAALPRSVVTWIEDLTGARPIAATPMVGGLSSEVTRLELDARAEFSMVVLRRHLDPVWLEREPDLVAREANALGLLAAMRAAGSATPTPAGASGPAARPAVPETPALIGCDPDGTITGTPALLMSHLDGTPIVSAGELTAVVDLLAGALADLHRLPLEPGHGLPAYRRWGARAPSIPTWTRRPETWRRAAEVLDAPMPSMPRTGPALLHRDYHPLNVLFATHPSEPTPVVSGVVDWVNACVGHPHADLGHVRWNLAVMVDQAAADRFLERYLTRTGSGPYDPWWDLASAFGLGSPGIAGWHAVGRTDLSAERFVEATDAFIAAALGRRGGPPDAGTG